MYMINAAAVFALTWQSGGYIKQQQQQQEMRSDGSSRSSAHIAIWVQKNWQQQQQPARWSAMSARCSWGCCWLGGAGGAAAGFCGALLCDSGREGLIVGGWSVH